MHAESDLEHYRPGRDGISKPTFQGWGCCFSRCEPRNRFIGGGTADGYPKTRFQSIGAPGLHYKGGSTTRPGSPRSAVVAFRGVDLARQMKRLYDYDDGFSHGGIGPVAGCPIQTGFCLGGSFV
jgi:hypothetical protein